MTVGDTLRATAPADLLSLRRQRLATLVRDNRGVLDVDDHGNPVRRDEIVGIGLSDEQIAKATAAGFAVRGTESIEALALGATIFTPPGKKPARKAIGALRALVPGAQFMLDPIYEPARAPLAPAGGAAEEVRGRQAARASA